MNTFANKVALVTGATSGIGRATAIAFAREGAKVVVSGRRDQEGRETVELVEKSGGQATFVKTDITSESEVAALVAKTLATYGRLDVAFNNAGIEGSRTGAWRPVPELSLEDFNEIVAVNTIGVFLGLKHVIPVMTAGGGGAIVNTSSINGLKGSRGQVAYVASKHAVTAMTVVAAKEGAASNIRVNAIAPGGINGRMMRDYMEIVRANAPAPAGLPPAYRPPPIAKWAEPREIAGLVAFLCSAEAAQVSGACYSVDGGLIAM